MLKKILLFILIYNINVFCLEEAKEKKERGEIIDYTLQDLRKAVDPSIRQSSLQNIIFDYINVNYSLCGIFQIREYNLRNQIAVSPNFQLIAFFCNNYARSKDTIVCYSQVYILNLLNNRIIHFSIGDIDFISLDNLFVRRISFSNDNNKFFLIKNKDTNSICYEISTKTKMYCTFQQADFNSCYVKYSQNVNQYEIYDSDFNTDPLFLVKCEELPSCVNKFTKIKIYKRVDSYRPQSIDKKYCVIL